MSNPMILLFVGLAYILLTGGLALFRREGLSLRFALEAVALTGLASGVIALSGYALNPVLFLVGLYLATMRVRLLVDLGTLFARQGRGRLANRLFGLGEHLGPDEASRLALWVNQATLWLQEDGLDPAIERLQAVLQESGKGYLGVKYEAAAHFNLGVAYQRKRLPARAIAEYNAVVDTWPGSLIAQRAQEALHRLRQRETGDHPAMG